MDKIGTLVKKALEHFDKQNNENIDLITNLNNKDILFNIKVKKDKDDKNYYSASLNKDIDSFEFKFFEDYIVEQLAIFDTQTKTWIWSWCIPIIYKDLVIESKHLLEYGLSLNTKIDQEDFYYLKVILTNSRINIEDELELEKILAVCSYLLQNRIKFIYRKTYDGKDNNNIIHFYLFK